MNKKIPLKAEVYDKLEEQAKAKGITVSQLSSKIIIEKAERADDKELPASMPTPTPEEKPKAKRQRKPKAEKPAESVEEKKTFLVEGFINSYGFLHLNTTLAEAFGAPKGKKTAVQIDFKDGTLVISKKV